MTCRLQLCSDFVVVVVVRCTLLDVMGAPGDELTFENSDLVVGIVTHVDGPGDALSGDRIG